MGARQMVERGVNVGGSFTCSHVFQRSSSGGEKLRAGVRQIPCSPAKHCECQRGKHGLKKVNICSYRHTNAAGGQLHFLQTLPCVCECESEYPQLKLFHTDSTSGDLILRRGLTSVCQEYGYACW